MLVNLKNFKLAKEFRQDAVEILKVYNLTLQALQHFKKYRTVQNSIDALERDKAEIEWFLNRASLTIDKSKRNT
jgi:hypothetical protein